MTPQEYLLERSGVVDAKTRAAIREACTAWDEERIALVEALASVPKRIRELEARLAVAGALISDLADTVQGYALGEMVGSDLEDAEATVARARAFLEGK